MKNKAVIAGAFVIVAAVSFYAGTKSSFGKTASGRAGQFTFGQGAVLGDQANGARTRAGGGFRAGNLVAGEILSASEGSITVKLRDGGSKIVFVPKTAAVTKSVGGTTADLIVGQSVMVSGATNQDGSVNAETIQIRPNLPAPTNTSGPVPTVPAN